MKKRKIQKNLQSKSKNKKNKCVSWVTALRVLSLPGSHSLPHLPRMPSSTTLVSGPAVGEAQGLIWSYSSVFLPPMSTAVRTDVFSLVGALSDLYMFHRHRVCLVDHMDLICSLYGWREGFGSFSLATLPLGLNCGFISTSACESSPGVCFWGCPGGPGLAPVRAGCGGGAAAWVAGVLAAPGAQGGWRQGQQKIWCARRAWQPVLANTLQYSCLENPSLTEKPGRPQCKGLQRVEHDQSDPACTDARLSPVSALPQRELSVKVAQLLGFRGPWWHRVCRDTAGLHCRGHGPIRVLSLS